MPRTGAVFNGNRDARLEGVVRGSEGVRDARLDGVREGVVSMTSAEGGESSLAMAVEFDHMYIGCGDSKASVGKELEVQHLKDLLLLHLDLIQQQAEQLVAKDKQIKLLREENEALKSKLERIDRRVSLSLHKRGVEHSTPRDAHHDFTIHSDLELSFVKSEVEDDVLSGELASKSPEVKAASPGTRASPRHASVAKVGSPRQVSPAAKASPATKTASPGTKPGSPKPLSPAHKPGSPLGRQASPGIKPGSPTTRLTNASQVSPLGRHASPPSKQAVSPARTTFLPSKQASPPGRPAVLACKQAMSPHPKQASPPSKPMSPSSKPGSPSSVRAASPSCRVDAVVSRQDSRTPLSSRVSRSDSAKKAIPKVVVPKSSPREMRPRRDTGQSQASENDTDIEMTEPSRRERRSVHKRRSDSETEMPAKRPRLDSRSEDGLDHNLRSRDKAKEGAKGEGGPRSEGEAKCEGGEKGEAGGSVERPATPTARAAALEAKKLRQRLLLKAEPPAGRGVRGDGILNTSVAYYLPYGGMVQEPNPEEECLQAQVEIPRWGTRVLTSLYVMEGTENLEDEVFLKRHAKPEQDEKRRKRWDLQRMREQRHYERLRERYEGRQNTSEPEAEVQGSLWPNPESALYLHMDDFLPVCAFGQPMARIPPEEFTLPWLSGRSTDGVSTRRRKR